MELLFTLTKDLRYLKSFSSSSRCPAVMLVSVMWLRLLTYILLFSSLISMPYVLAIFSSLVVSSWSLASLLPMRTMSPAKRSFEMGLPSMDMELWNSSSASSMMFFKKMVNKTRKRRQPWRTPTGVLKGSPILLLIRAALLAFVQRACIKVVVSEELPQPLHANHGQRLFWSQLICSNIFTCMTGEAIGSVVLALSWVPLFRDVDK